MVSYPIYISQKCYRAASYLKLTCVTVIFNPWVPGFRFFVKRLDFHNGDQDRGTKENMFFINNINWSQKVLAGAEAYLCCTRQGFYLNGVVVYEVLLTLLEIIFGVRYV